jgi:hypothetical protein
VGSGRRDRGGAQLPWRRAELPQRRGRACGSCGGARGGVQLPQRCVTPSTLSSGGMAHGRPVVAVARRHSWRAVGFGPCCNRVFHMFRTFHKNVASVLRGCWKSKSGCFQCCGVLRRVFKCCRCCFKMLQMLFLNVA